MRRIVVLLALFVAALFASAERNNGSIDVPANVAASAPILQDNQADDARRQIAFSSNARRSPLESFMEKVDEQIRMFLALLDAEREIVRNHTTH